MGNNLNISIFGLGYVGLPLAVKLSNYFNVLGFDKNKQRIKELKSFLDKNNEIKKILIYPKKSKAMNLAFDVTPAKYVTGLITEKGVCEASSEGLKGLFK